MGADIGYEFASTGGGDETGFNDAVTTTFNTNFSNAIAREAIQNIIDANVDPTGKAKVRAKFSLVNIAVSNIPEINQFALILEACRDYVNRNPDGRKFYEYALSLISKGAIIPILKIEDFGTTGLSGDDGDTLGNFYNFMKSIGSSAKSGSEGGSFGLGKGSFYAASAFRTIFVSSIHDNERHLFMGKSRLVSHKVGGDIKQGNGSFGMRPGQKPIRSLDKIPNIFRRTQKGTDIYILGYQDAVEWKQNIVKSVLSNFWLAILNGTLEVMVNGDEEITAATLAGVMKKYFTETSTDVLDDDSPLPYFEAYTNQERRVLFKECLPTLGNVELYISIGENLPKRVAYFRKTGMLIKRAIHRCYLPYAAVFVCSNDVGNDILRRMEPPAHDNWTKESPRAKGDDGKPFPEAVRAEKELKTFINDKLKSLVRAGSTEILQIPGLSRYLYLPGDEINENINIGEAGMEDSSKSSLEETGTEVGALTPEGSTKIQSPIRLEVIKKRSEGKIGEGLDIANVGTGKSGGGGGGGGGGTQIKEGGTATAGEGNDMVKILSDIKCRSFASLNKENIFEHVLILRGVPNTKCDLYLQAGTDDAFDEIEIEKVFDQDAKLYTVSNAKIKDVVLDTKGNKKISVIFKSHERYSIRVVAYESK